MTALRVIELEPVPGRLRTLHGGAVVGRGPEADVRIVSPRVSRRHALIWTCAGATAIEDLGSLDGTWVNGRRIEDIVRLGPGDEVALGDLAWRVLRRRPAQKSSIEFSSNPK